MKGPDMKNTVWIDDTDNDGISRDAEKRWHDPAVFRAAVAAGDETEQFAAHAITWNP